jgi:hypothetical protein
MAFLRGEPTKAFIYQDQEAHIQAHQSFMQDPMIAATIGQNPMAQQMQAAIMAHIAEHLAFKYRKDVEEQVGVPLPNPDADLPEDVEVQLSRLVSQGSQQLMQKNAAEAQQAQAQQQAQDPLVQIQQAELQIKQADVQRKTQKDQTDGQIAMQKLQLEKLRIEAEIEKETQRLKSQELQTKARIEADLVKNQMDGMYRNNGGQ